MPETARPRTLDTARLGPLEAWLAQALEAKAVTIAEARLLSGGAVQENWRLDVEVMGGPRQGPHAWVLRTDAAATLPISLSRDAEFRVIEAAHKAGVAVAEPIARCPDPAVIGAPFLLQAFVPGQAQGRRLVRDPELGQWGESLGERLGQELARIHAIRPPRDELPLTYPMPSPAKAAVAQLRKLLDGASEPRPALEYVLCWLDANAPAKADLVLCHGDFRTGNYLVAGGRLAAILDWEFAHWGDPHEDIGWLSARCWRFGNDDRPVGGIASWAAFARGYNSASDRTMDESAIPYWKIMAAARWAAVAVVQGDRHHSGREPSLELLLTGVMAPEMELDAIDGIASFIRAREG